MLKSYTKGREVYFIKALLFDSTFLRRATFNQACSSLYCKSGFKENIDFGRDYSLPLGHNAVRRGGVEIIINGSFFFVFIYSFVTYPKQFGPCFTRNELSSPQNSVNPPKKEKKHPLKEKSSIVRWERGEIRGISLSRKCDSGPTPL